MTGFDTRLLTGVGVLAALTEAGNFARAAEVLGLTPSKHGEPGSPHGLIHHDALLFRDPQTGLPFPREFQRSGKVVGP